MENINQENPEFAFNSGDAPNEIAENHAPNNPPWGSLAAILLWVASVFLIGFFQTIFVVPYAVSQNISFGDKAHLASFLTSDPKAIILTVVAVFPAHMLTLGLAWLVVTKFNRFSFRKMLGWKLGGFKWWHLILLLLVVFLLLLTTTSIFGQQDNDFVKMLRSSRTVVFIVAILATFSAPIVEEVVYRGVLYSAFQKTMGTPIGTGLQYIGGFSFFASSFARLRKVNLLRSLKSAIETVQRYFHIHLAVFLVTAVFAIVHYPQYWGDYSTLITLTFLSLVITLIRVKTNNLLPCIIFHFVVNGIQSVLLILQPYLPESLDATKPAEAFYYFIQ